MADMIQKEANVEEWTNFRTSPCEAFWLSFFSVGFKKQHRNLRQISKSRRKVQEEGASKTPK